MGATLTLDNDVIDLLERARQEEGRSLDEMANELLRRTLQRLGAPPAGDQSSRYQGVTEALDRVYVDEPSELDAGLAKLQSQALDPNEW